MRELSKEEKDFIAEQMIAILNNNAYGEIGVTLDNWNTLDFGNFDMEVQEFNLVTSILEVMTE